MSRRTRWITLVLAVLCAVVGASLLAVRRLRPRRTAVAQSRAVATPDQLRAQCRDAVGPPRVERISEHVWLAIGYDLANTILIHTDAGNVVVDVSMSPARAQAVRAALTAVAPGRTLAVIYTHSHIDHTGGASAWVEPGTEIWGTDALAEHFIKQYGEFRTAETRRGAGQYGAHIDEDSLPCCTIGRRLDFEHAVVTGALLPTRTFSGHTELTFGGVRVELVEAHGETHDQLFVWLPAERVLMPGDNYYRAFPNLYTIRGTSPRPVDAWIDSLDLMRRRAPEHLVPSHTVPLHGRANILGALTRYRDAIQWVRDRVVAGANAGMRLEALVESIGLPPAVASDPALAPLYGQVDWSARAIYTNHLGWFDGSPEALYPLCERDEATRTVAMMGGADRVWSTVDATVRTDPRWALRLLTLLRNAGAADEAPGGRWALASATALESVAATVGNSNGRGYLLESAYGRRHGVPALPTPRASAAVLDAVPMATVFHVMASRLLPELSAGVHESVRFDLTDSHETFFLTIRHGVLEVAKGDALPDTPAPLAVVTTTASAWRRVATDTLTPAAAVASGELRIAGDTAGFYTFSQRFRRGL
jgi:alkyl sulfatase BDS1-like metallo-beta-lactamase superfamily hydrolase